MITTKRNTKLEEQALIFDKIVETRRSVRIYDAQAAFDHKAVSRSLERAVLAPNSSNLQLWEFYRIKSPEMLKKAHPLCLGQSAAKTANEIVAIVCRPDLWRERRDKVFAEIEPTLSKPLTDKDKRAVQYYQSQIPILYSWEPTGIWGGIKKMLMFFMAFNKPFVRYGSASDIRVMVHKSAALAAQTFMLSMTAEGYDTCPMEGFDEKRMKKLLGLPWRSEICMLVSCGKGTPEGIYSERYRVPNEEVIFEV